MYMELEEEDRVAIGHRLDNNPSGLDFQKYVIR
jgi:hypothetical protein